MSEGRRRGFTLVELLVVIAILGMLGGLVILFSGRKTGCPTRDSAVKNMLVGLEIANSTYEFDWNAFVPDVSVCNFPSATSNGYAGKSPKGSESLYYCLSCTFKRTPQPAKNEIGPCLKDASSSPYFQASSERHRDVTGTGMDSFLDCWNQPIQYDNIHENGYTPQPWNGLADPRGGTPKSNTADIFSFGSPAEKGQKPIYVTP